MPKMRATPTVSRALAACLLCAACAAPPGDERPVPLTGTGRDEAGTDLRVVSTTGRDGSRILGITQGRTRACVGRYAEPTFAAPERSFPLSCGDGVEGRAVVRESRLGLGRTVRFTLSTGESGRARL